MEQVIADPDARICRTIAHTLMNRVGSDRFDRYFRDAARLELEGETLTVRVDSPFYKDWLIARFAQPLLEAAREVTGNPRLTLNWSAEPPSAADPSETPHNPAPTADDPQPRRAGRPAPQSRRAGAASRSLWRSGSNASLRHRLDEFVVGPGNRIPLEAATRLADLRSDPGYRLLFIHGRCGVGKTHLLQGIAQRVAESSSHDKPRVWYATGEAFTNEYVASVRTGRIEAFRKQIRALDLLCIDDVHFIAGKSSTQSECLHTLDALDLGGARVALASDAHPRQIENFSERLRSRCLSGLMLELTSPDRETRMQMIESMARMRGFLLQHDAVQIIEQSSGPTARDLEGVLTRIDAVRRLTTLDGLVSAALVRSVIDSASTFKPRRPIRAELIVDVICRELGIDRAEILGPGRHKRLVLARSLAAYLARELTTQSYPEIARALGRPSHSSVITACQRFTRQTAETITPSVGADLVGMTHADLCSRLRSAVVQAA